MDATSYFVGYMVVYCHQRIVVNLTRLTSAHHQQILRLRRSRYWPAYDRAVCCLLAADSPCGKDGAVWSRRCFLLVCSWHEAKKTPSHGARRLHAAAATASVARSSPYCSRQRYQQSSAGQPSSSGFHSLPCRFLARFSVLSITIPTSEEHRGCF